MTDFNSNDTNDDKELGRPPIYSETMARRTLTMPDTYFTLLEDISNNQHGQLNASNGGRLLIEMAKKTGLIDELLAGYDVEKRERKQ